MHGGPRAPATVLSLLTVACVGACADGHPVTAATVGEVRDVRYFLERLHDVRHLPELGAGHTAMESTWDRSGGNDDGDDFAHVEGDHNVLLDVDGPGCLHRIFTGVLGDAVAGTEIEITLDHAREPLLRMPVEQFFSLVDGPFPPPLTAGFPYPGVLMPIPFARHLRVQLVHAVGGDGTDAGTMPDASTAPRDPWGVFWQLTYSTYGDDVRVKSMRWPLNADERDAQQRVVETWNDATRGRSAPVAGQRITTTRMLVPGHAATIELPGCGVIRELTAAFDPDNAALWRQTQLTVRWDGETTPSIDAPLAYLFGNAQAGEEDFDSLLLGARPTSAYVRLPMPFARGARIVVENRSAIEPARLTLRFTVEGCVALPPDIGRLHAAYRRQRAALDGGPTAGPEDTPALLVLDHQGRGKYVGTLLYVEWPSERWWGEGDWLIWSDERGWPPSYHGTGTEEYFNSGWNLFDRKAVSGVITSHPGLASAYSFHLNDSFAFRESIRVMVETVAGDAQGQALLREQHPAWQSTAFWYEPAASR